MGSANKKTTKDSATRRRGRQENGFATYRLNVNLLHLVDLAEDETGGSNEYQRRRESRAVEMSSSRDVLRKRNGRQRESKISTGSSSPSRSFDKRRRKAHLQVNSRIPQPPMILMQNRRSITTRENTSSCSLSSNESQPHLRGSQPNRSSLPLPNRSFLPLSVVPNLLHNDGPVPETNEELALVLGCEGSEEEGTSEGGCWRRGGDGGKGVRVEDEEDV